MDLLVITGGLSVSIFSIFRFISILLLSNSTEAQIWHSMRKKTDGHDEQSLDQDSDKKLDGDLVTTEENFKQKPLSACLKIKLSLMELGFDICCFRSKQEKQIKDDFLEF